MERRQHETVEDGLRAVLRAFCEIPVELPGARAASPVLLSPPYCLNGGDRRTGAEGRRAANPPVAALLSEVVEARRSEWPNARRVLMGKGTPEEIRVVVREAVRRGLVPTPAADTAEAWRLTLRQWMADYGLGIDCSGFAQQVLTAVRHLLPGGEAITAIGQRQIGSQGFAAPPFRPLVSLAELQCGDTMVLAPPPNYPYGHVRVVVHVEPDAEGVVFTTVEATSEGGRPEPNPTKHQPPSIGPLERRWRYWEGHLQVWQEPERVWQPSLDRPTFTRLSSTGVTGHRAS